MNDSRPTGDAMRWQGWSVPAIDAAIVARREKQAAAVLRGDHAAAENHEGWIDRLFDGRTYLTTVSWRSGTPAAFKERPVMTGQKVGRMSGETEENGGARPMTDESANSVRRLRIRKTHPALYRALMVLGFMGVALALNFWFSRPTFNPYGVPKEVVGVVFFALGAAEIIFLNLLHDLRMVRIVLAVSVSFMFFWGASNAQQFFAGHSSLQLPILYVAISIMQIPLLIESPVNTMTKKKR